jgi:hypothetical protein
MMSDLEHCLAILKALQIAEVSYWLSGSGDSGTVEIHQVLYADGHSGPMPSVTIDVTDVGSTISLDERLDAIICDLPDGDWINNEGGYGNVVLRPQETDPDCQVECAMTYGEESGREGDFEDDQNSGDDFEDDDPAATAATVGIAVNDSALQLEKGEDQ